jgi:hypothetical protein
MPLSNPFCNLDCEEYNYKCSLIDQDDEEVNNIFSNWDSIVKADEEEETEDTRIMDNVSVQASYFDSDIDDDFDNVSEISYCKEDEFELHKKEKHWQK